MISTPIALAVLALLLAGPVPVLLSRTRWPARAPATARVLWQAIALAGGLSMLGALLDSGLAPFGPDLLCGGLAFTAPFLGHAPWGDANVVHVLALAGAILLGGHLLLNLLVTVVRAERERRRHAQLDLLLSTPCQTLPAPDSSTTPPPSRTACRGPSSL